MGRIPFFSTVIGLGGQTLARHTETVEEGARLTHSILDEGVNYIDTNYPGAQEKIGPVMKTRRDEVFLTAKTQERTKEGAARHLREHLRALQTDHLDCYKIHALDSMEDAEKVLSEDGALTAFLEAREQGLVRYIGITGHLPEVIARMLNAFNFDSILVPVNPVANFLTQLDAGLIAQARGNDAAVIAMKPWLSDSDVPDKDTAIRYLLSLPISVIIPRSPPECVRQAIKVAREHERLSQEEESRLLAWYGNRVCRQCNYCLPCPKGVEIPLLFRLDYYADYTLWYTDLVKRQYVSLAVKLDACDECGECEKRCPFEIPIIRRLREIDRKLRA